MRFRWAIVLGTILLSLFMLFRSTEESKGFHFDNIRENIHLGLDLQGGIFMQLEVDDEDAVVQFLEEQAGSIKASLSTDQIEADVSDSDPENDSVVMTNVRYTGSESWTEDRVVREIKDRYDGMWGVTRRGADVVLRLREQARNQVKDDAVRQAVYKIQNRIDQLGVTEPNITRTLGSNRIVLELAGADDVERVHNIVKEPGKLEWRLVEPGTRVFPLEQQALQHFGGALPAGKRILPYVGDAGEESGFQVVQEVLLTSSNIANVFESSDQTGLPAVGVNLDRTGAQVFSRVTGANVGNQLAIVLDGKVISAPVINSQLADSFVISGAFSRKDVQEMVIKIKSGSLPADVRILEERVIGPTLGRDAIRQGIYASSLGLILVVLFILLYYRRAGVYAFIALAMNLVIIMGLLSGIGAVLTLPGIAGFILTIGMAVDANVLVFERIREELRAGIDPHHAVDTGYKQAFVTIMDANVTTFIAAFCLLLMGQGPVKGFAIMLMIGIVSSIFTAVFCSRTFFLSYLNRHRTLHKLSIWPIWRSSQVTAAASN